MSKMYVNGDTIIKLAALAGALGTLGIILYRVFRWMERQKVQDIEIQNIKKEQCIICFALLATLDGLKQLGANGGVTEAHKKLGKHLNQSAHKWEGE
ncbi:MAG: branched-chain amino acid ABC transporter permease [Clostridia bacterium]|nr:branched-chain amino acid ABC transporter permease [Clostridia bacterium]